MQPETSPLRSSSIERWSSTPEIVKSRCHVARLDRHQPGAPTGGDGVGDEQRSQPTRIHEIALRQPDANDIVLLCGEQVDTVGVDFADDDDRPVAEIIRTGWKTRRGWASPRVPRYTHPGSVGPGGSSSRELQNVATRSRSRQSTVTADQRFTTMVT